MQGVFVPLQETLSDFADVLAGKYDDLPENAFWCVGVGLTVSSGED